MNQKQLDGIFKVFLLCAIGLIGAACGGGESSSYSSPSPTPPSETAVTLDVMSIDTDTDVAFFGMGHSSTNLPYGGKGIIVPTTPRKAEITFQNVPEGENYRVDYVGYHHLTSFPARPAAPYGWLCYYERAAKVINVVSGAVNTVTLEPELKTNSCTYLGAGRYVVNPNYFADARDPYYGSIDGENVLPLFIHNLGASLSVTIKACDTVDPSCTAPFGVFETLPDGVYTPWPVHTGSGWGRELAVTTDGSGDAIVYLVVKPGESPQFWEIEVEYPAGTTPGFEVFRVRVSNGNSVEIIGQ